MKSTLLRAAAPALGLAFMTSAASAELVITGVFDGPLSGGTPKGVEVYVLEDIADLSQYGIGSANNGGGTDGNEFSFPADSVSAGTFIYVSSEASNFEAYFGFAPNYTTGVMGINGDDAVELFFGDTVIDTFGQIDVDGNGTTWEYLDSWAYRVDGVGTNGTAFVDTDFTYGGPNALDGCSDNGTCESQAPLGTWQPGGSEPVVHVVYAGNFYYNPQTVDVNIGDTIQWIWEGGNHDAVDGDIDNCAKSGEYFDVLITSSNPTAEWVVSEDAPAQIDYFCTVGSHCAFGMVGTINVLDAGVQDADEDTIPDEQDNCPDDANVDQADFDEDGVGDVCDNCPDDANANQADGDGDLVGTICDNCPDDANADQADSDGDGNGDACDLCPGEDDNFDGDENGVPDCQEVDVPEGLRISEIRIDQPGSDSDEYFELQGPVGTNLEGISYIVIGDGSGGAGSVEAVVNLTGVIDDTGYFLVAEDSFTIVDVAEADQVASINFENSDNVTHLLVANYTGGFADLDADDDGVLDSSPPWLQLIDSVSLVETNDGTGDRYYGEAEVGPTVDGFVPGHAYRCAGSGEWTIGLFDSFDDDTPASANLDCIPKEPTGACCVGEVTGDYCVDGQTFEECSNLGTDPTSNGWFQDETCEDIGCGLAACEGDFDDDGKTNIADLLFVIANWGKPYTVTDLLLVISDWNCGV